MFINSSIRFNINMQVNYYFTPKMEKYKKLCAFSLKEISLSVTKLNFFKILKLSRIYCTNLI